MAFNYSQGFFLLVVASMFAGSMANTVVVGGSAGWRFGFNYTDWSIKNSPFYLRDTLVFKYDPPSRTPFEHSVFLIRDYWSFLRCDLRGAKMVANVSDGAGQGFKFVLNQWRPYFFVCGEKNGFHCNNGLMKFMVMPLPRCHGQ